MTSRRVAIIGDYDPDDIAHPETGGAIAAAARRGSFDVGFEWVSTDAVGSAGAGALADFDGIWMASGGPYRSLDGALAGIRYARKSGKPFVGT